jgi:hypothetical protein
VLYSPSAEQHEVEYVARILHSIIAYCLSIVAISGLGGHAYGSFKEREGQHMWLSDSLPKDLPTARIITYGYESGLANSTGFQNLDDLGNALQKALQTLQGIYVYGVSTTISSNYLAFDHLLTSGFRFQQEPPEQKPIIFIAHSLGGLIVKEVGAQSQSSWPSMQLEQRLKLTTHVGHYPYCRVED